MGKTGKAAGAHLHWGIKRNGEWIDPEPYLNKDYPVEPAVKYITLEVPVLKRGMKGDAVRALQAQLVGLGYQIAVDGSFGAKTEEAVKQYQRDHGLKEDGSVGRKTRSKLLGLEGG
jgi:peptidoglycan hydrolase-like protein with peptidoglycan-binding domain